MCIVPKNHIRIRIRIRPRARLPNQSRLSQLKTLRLLAKLPFFKDVNIQNLTTHEKEVFQFVSCIYNAE